MKTEPAYWAVVPAAGVGARMGAPRPKQYLELDGRTVLEHTIRRLGDHPAIAGVVVALGPEDARWSRLAFGFDKPLITVEGGSERCHSVLNALDHLLTLAGRRDWVLVHDAARPCLRPDDIDRLIAELSGHAVGGLLGLPVTDTVKRADASGDVAETVARDGLWRALTPQMFRLDDLHGALSDAIAAGDVVTDEAAAMERAGRCPRLVEGRADNIKITRPGDLELAAFFLRQQAEEAAASRTA